MTEAAEIAGPEQDRRLEFDPVEHRYFFNGAEVPSVTAILRDAGLVDFSFCSEFAKWRGSAVHQAIHLELTVGLDWASVPESFHPFISAAKQALADLGAVTEATERRVYSPAFRYAGTIDWVGPIPPAKRKVILDWKSGPPEKVYGLQLAGYAEAYAEECRTDLIPPLRYCCHLKQDGDYTLKPYADREDFHNFRAAIRTARLRKEYGLA